MADLLRVRAVVDVIVDVDAWRTEYGYADDSDVAGHIEGDVWTSAKDGFHASKWDGLLAGLPTVQTSASAPSPVVATAGGEAVVRVVMLAEPIRIGNTVNGNPRYRLVTLTRGDYQEYVTMSDAGFTYGIGNGWAGKRQRGAVLTLTRAGRVRHLEYLD